MEAWTREWYKAQFEGACHNLNLHARDLLKQEERIKAAHRRMDEWEQELKEHRVKLGKKFVELDLIITRLKAKAGISEDEPVTKPILKGD